MTKGEVIRQPHIPYQLDTKRKYETLEKKIISAIEDGLPVRDAFIVAGIPAYTYYKWREYFLEDINDGFTGTNLIMLMFNVMKADKTLFRRLSKKMFEKVDEGDTRMIMYLADNRFGYANKRKNTLEVGTKDNSGTTINIVNMTSVEQDDENETVEIEVNGKCGDDSNSTEMD